MGKVLVLRQEHLAFVATWVGRADSASPADLVSFMSEGTASLWVRSEESISIVTIKAVFDRAHFYALREYPFLRALKVNDHGIDFSSLQGQVQAIDPKELSSAFIQLLTEYLTIMGNLTAEVFTPSLHAALRKVEFNARDAAANRIIRFKKTEES